METKKTENQQVPAQEKGRVTYQVAGQDVTLSYNIVRNFLTKGNGSVTDSELVQFISICKFNQLNPFLNEAYLVKFQGQADNAQMIVSKEALMKRAEACPEYDGLKAGIIVERNGDIIDVQGSFKLPTDKLLGGWAEVYRKDRSHSYISRVSLDEYDKKQSIWNNKKTTMIRKTAIVQALREAFPSQLGALYTAEEQEPIKADNTVKSPTVVNIDNVQYEDVTDQPTAQAVTGATEPDPGY